MKLWQYGIDLTLPIEKNKHLFNWLWCIIDLFRKDNITKEIVNVKLLI